jgi:hypothetical protein
MAHYKSNCYGYTKTKNQLILESFTHSDADRMLVDSHEYASKQSCCGSLNTTARNLHLVVKAVIEDGEVYLIKPY